MMEKEELIQKIAEANNIQNDEIHAFWELFLRKVFSSVGNGGKLTISEVGRFTVDAGSDSLSELPHIAFHAAGQSESEKPLKIDVPLFDAEPVESIDSALSLGVSLPSFSYDTTDQIDTISSKHGTGLRKRLDSAIDSILQDSDILQGDTKDSLPWQYGNEFDQDEKSEEDLLETLDEEEISDSEPSEDLIEEEEPEEAIEETEDEPEAELTEQIDDFEKESAPTDAFEEEPQSEAEEELELPEPDKDISGDFDDIDSDFESDFADAFEEKPPEEEPVEEEEPLPEGFSEVTPLSSTFGLEDEPEDIDDGNEPIPAMDAFENISKDDEEQGALGDLLNQDEKSEDDSSLEDLWSNDDSGDSSDDDFDDLWAKAQKSQQQEVEEETAKSQFKDELEDDVLEDMGVGEKSEAEESIEEILSASIESDFDDESFQDAQKAAVEELHGKQDDDEDDDDIDSMLAGLKDLDDSDESTNYGSQDEIDAMLSGLGGDDEPDADEIDDVLGDVGDEPDAMATPPDDPFDDDDEPLPPMDEPTDDIAATVEEKPKKKAKKEKKKKAKKEPSGDKSSVKWILIAIIVVACTGAVAYWQMYGIPAWMPFIGDESHDGLSRTTVYAHVVDREYDVPVSYPIDNKETLPQKLLFWGPSGLSNSKVQGSEHHTDVQRPQRNEVTDSHEENNTPPPPPPEEETITHTETDNTTQRTDTRTNRTNRTDEYIVKEDPKSRKILGDKGFDYDYSRDRVVHNNIFTDGRYFTIQLSSWKTREKAIVERDKHISNGIKAYIVVGNIPGSGTWYRVRTGQFETQSAAESFSGKILPE